MGVRTFVAIDLPELTRMALAAVQAGLGPGRRVPEENLHLTLAFAGDVDNAWLADLHAALEEIHVPRFPLQLAGLGVLGTKQSRALVIGVRSEPRLDRLQQSTETALRRNGFKLPRRRFRPHVTLARFGQRHSARDQVRLAEFLAAKGVVELEPFTVKRFVLYRSELHPNGAVHTALAEYPLSIPA